MGRRAGPLAGRSILLTRPAGRGDDLARRLVSLGARVERRPSIAFELPTDPGPADAAVARLSDYDLIVFTSAEAVRAFEERRRTAAARPSSRCRIAAVGDATAGALRSVGLVPEVVARDSRAEGLAAALRTVVRPGMAALWPRPEVAREVLAEALSAAGVRLDAPAFYRTVPAPGVPATAEALAQGRFDVAIFTSPSGFQRLLDAGKGMRGFVDALACTRRVAIGAVTAATMRDEGFPAHAVAERPSDDAIAEAVVRSVAD